MPQPRSIPATGSQWKHHVLPHPSFFGRHPLRENLQTLGLGSLDDFSRLLDPESWIPPVRRPEPHGKPPQVFLTDTFLLEKTTVGCNRSSPWFEPFSGLAQNMWAAEPGVRKKWRMTADPSPRRVAQSNPYHFAVCRPVLPTVEVRGGKCLNFESSILRKNLPQCWNQNLPF